MSLMLSTGPAVEPTDRELCDRYLSGDQAAFTCLYNKWWKYVFVVCNNCCHDHLDAEDSASKTFVKVAKYLPTFEWRSSFKTWIHQIAVSSGQNIRAREVVRGKKVRVSLNQMADRDDTSSLFGLVKQNYLLTYEQLVSEQREDSNTIDTVVLNELSEAIENGLNRITPRRREMLNLRVHNFLEYEEICQQLNVKMNTVKSGLHRARTDLKKTIVEKHPEMQSYFDNRE